MPNSIITILGNYYSLLASSLSKRWGIPLSVFVHDDWTRGAKSLKELEVSNQQVRKVLQQATQIWAVTPELAEKCKSFTSSKARVSTLLPIPEETAAAYIYHSWNKSYKNPPTIAHAGTVESFHIPYFMLILKSLSNFGGKLIIISSVETNPHIKRFQEECKLQGFNNIEIVDFFHTVHEAKLYLQEKASCLLVVYPLEPQLEYFLATSFPSRLVEFSHLGLPLMIIASQKSSLGKWAKQNLLSSYFSQADFEEINIFVKNLMNEGEWRILAEETQRIARSRFNPGEIHSQFLSELARN